MKLKLTDQILLAAVGGLFVYATLWLIWVRLHWETLAPVFMQQ